MTSDGLRSPVHGLWSSVVSRQSPVTSLQSSVLCLRSSVFVVVAALALAGQAPAQFNRTTLLIDTPTADVMPAGSFAISPIVTMPLTRTPTRVGTEGGASLRFSPVKYMEVALTAYTPKDYVVGASYQLVSGRGERVSVLEMLYPKERAGHRLVNEEARGPALAVGVYDLGINNYVSPIGHGLDDAWPDWKYKDRPMENFSAFLVTSIPMTGLARISLGLGRGRFVGYDGPNEYLNTDVFFKENHQWAIGLFGGLEIYLAPQVALCAEAQGRDANAGIKAFIGPVTALVSLCKIEGLVFAQGADKFGRVAFEASYQIDNLFRPRVPLARPSRASRFGSVRGRTLDAGTGAPLEAQVALGSRVLFTARDDGSFEFDSVAPGPYTIRAAAKGLLGASAKVGVTAGTVSIVDIRLAPEPGKEAPPVAVPSPAELKLSPVYFEYDRSDITTEAAAILRENADLLKSNPNVRVMITGRASEEGTLESDSRLAERRAAAAFEYLKSLGVPAEQMSYRSLGREPGTPPRLARRCDFEAEK